MIKVLTYVDYWSIIEIVKQLKERQVMKEFENWREIKAWAVDNGFDKLAKRLQLNNDCWASSGEFGRSQVYLCDSLRACESEAERLEVGEQLEAELSEDELLKIVKVDNSEALAYC